MDWGSSPPGQTVDESKVVRTFVPSDGRDPDHLAQMLADIPPEIIRVVVESMQEAGLGERETGSTTLVMALSDHVANAVERVRRGIDITYPLLGEVSNLYPQEYAQGRAMLASLNARLDVTLPDGEATALAMHLVNAGFATGDLSYTYTMTGVIQQLLDIIDHSYGITLDRSSVNVGRFITHLRYLFVRIHQHQQLTDEPAPVMKVIRESYPAALRCARTIASCSNCASTRISATTKPPIWQCTSPESPATHRSGSANRLECTGHFGEIRGGI